MKDWRCYLTIAALALLVGSLVAPMIESSGELLGLAILLVSALILGGLLQLLVRFLGCPFSDSCPTRR